MDPTVFEMDGIWEWSAPERAPPLVWNGPAEVRPVDEERIFWREWSFSDRLGFF